MLQDIKVRSAPTLSSPVLANLALDGLEKMLRERYPTNTRRSRRAQVNLVRYADDFIITGSSRQLLEGEIKPLVVDFLQERGLELSAEKTRITHIENGFDFLGQNVRKYKGKLLIKPSPRNCREFLGKVREQIRTHKPMPAGGLVILLNPLIRGWANYHRHVVSKRIFEKMDCAIFKALWQWARRRHPQKGRRWIARKYFLRGPSSAWVFYGHLPGKAGELEMVSLLKASSIAINRHVKIRGEANPYDPEWEDYFDTRLGVKMEATLRGRRKLHYLWKQQQGLCPNCNQKITELSGWHSHHLVRRSNGGSDSTANLILLHPNCHNQVHSQRLTVTKPRLAGGVRKA